MKLIVTVLFASLFVSDGFAQLASRPSQDEPTTQSDLSPFSHLKQLLGTSAAEHFQCLPIYYYVPNANNFTYTESLPVSSSWAIKVTPPTNAARACTVWTVNYDFYLTPGDFTKKDTIHIYVREGNNPGQNIHSIYFLARAGTNSGEVEIDPPPPPGPGAPPTLTHAILNPIREVFVGMWISGDSAATVTWTFKTPSSFTNPVRSFKYISQGSIVPASTALGTSVDFKFSVRECCFFPVPVELSLFRGTYEGGRIRLTWRTETETNNYRFEVQRAMSPDGPWEPRGAVPGHGTTTTANLYQFSDDPPPPSAFGSSPQVWYRLLQVDFDGTISEVPAISVALRSDAEEGYQLYPSYPNPLLLSLHDRASIRFHLLEDRPVSLKVYNILGREIASLYDGVATAGYHEVAWTPFANGTAPETGRYFVRITAGDYSATQPITVLR